MAEHAEQEDGAAGAIATPQEQEIRIRAWEISQREDAGSPEENWERAIDELRAEGAQAAGS